MAARLGEDFLYICHMTPFISIIIPFYGTADPVLLQRCITSIREQGMEEGSYEIIVADDESQTTGGARNRGMQQAHGEYLFFVDADDILVPNTLRSCLPLLKLYSPDILKFGFKEFTSASSLEKQNPTNQLPSYAEYSSGAHFMALNNFTGVVWAHFFRRSLLETSSLYFSKTSLFEDEEFVAKAYFFARKMLVTSYKVYGYYCSSSSLTRMIAEDGCRRRVSDFKEMLFRLKAFSQACQSDASVERLEALNRRIHFLVIDYIRQMWRNKCGINEMNRQLAILKQAGLVPLPYKKYSWKYRLVCPAINVYIRFVI